MNTESRTVCVCAVLSCLLLLLSGCEDKQEQARALPNVLYTEVRAEPVTLTALLPGRVSALMISEVRPQVSGIVQERFFEEGTDVEAGQILYQIDPALFEAARDNAQANLDKAEASAESARLLAERMSKIVHAVSRQEYDDAVAAHRHAKAEVQACREALRTATINLSYTKVTAPVSGRIGRSYVTPGALVTQNQAEPLSTIQHLDTVYVDVSQSSTELLQLRRALAAGQLQASGPESAKVRLLLEDGTPYTRSLMQPEASDSADWIDGELLFSDVTIDQSTGMVSLRAKFDNPHKLLLPGMYVKAVLEEGVLDRAVLVPQKAVMRDTRGRPYVYVLTEDAGHCGAYLVSTRHVDIDRNVGNRWLLRSGLEDGEKLLVEGIVKARPGQLVAAAPEGREDIMLTAVESPSKVR